MDFEGRITGKAQVSSVQNETFPRHWITPIATALQQETPAWADSTDIEYRHKMTP